METRDERAIEAVKWAAQTYNENSAGIAGQLGRGAGPDGVAPHHLALLLGRAIVELETIRVELTMLREIAERGSQPGESSSWRPLDTTS